MGGQTNIIVRMIICAFMAVGAWNAGIFLSRTFIQHLPYEFNFILGFVIPALLGCAIGFFWKSK